MNELIQSLFDQFLRAVSSQLGNPAKIQKWKNQINFENHFSNDEKKVEKHSKTDYDVHRLLWTHKSNCVLLTWRFDKKKKKESKWIDEDNNDRNKRKTEKKRRKMCVLGDAKMRYVTFSRFIVKSFLPSRSKSLRQHTPNRRERKLNKKWNRTSENINTGA